MAGSRSWPGTGAGSAAGAGEPAGGVAQARAARRGGCVAHECASPTRAAKVGSGGNVAPRGDASGAASVLGTVAARRASPALTMRKRFANAGSARRLPASMCGGIALACRGGNVQRCLFRGHRRKGKKRLRGAMNTYAQGFRKCDRPLPLPHAPGRSRALKGPGDRKATYPAIAHHFLGEGTCITSATCLARRWRLPSR